MSRQEYYKKYYEANKETIKERSRQYSKANYSKAKYADSWSGRTRPCQYCGTDIKNNYWNKHIESIKHRNNYKKYLTDRYVEALLNIT